MVDPSESNEREDAPPLVTFAGDWSDAEREQVVQVVKAIEWNTSLPAPPEGWTPWHVSRVVVNERPLYTAHRWHLEAMPLARTIDALLEKMKAMTA